MGRKLLAMDIDGTAVRDDYSMGTAYEIPGQDLLKGEFVSKCLEYRVYQRGQHLECPY